MNTSFAYILNRRAFRDSSFLLDIFTQDFGRICCVARPAKKRGKIVTGNLEPFRYLHLNWVGKGEVQTLTEADERGRHAIPPSEMMLGLYLNELILLLTRQHVASPELFSAYKYTLHKLGDPVINHQVMMRFELYLLATLGYPIAANSNTEISPNISYRFTLEGGVIHNEVAPLEAEHEENQAMQGVLIQGELLLAMQNIQTLQDHHWKQLRTFLDEVFKRLAPRPIQARRLLRDL